MSVTIPDTNLILEKVSSTAEKWGPGAVCGVMIVGSIILGGFLSGPTIWNDYVAERTAKIASDKDIRMAQIASETEARRLEREIMQSSVSAIIMRQEQGNERLNEINKVLSTNSKEIADGFQYTIKRLEEIAVATGRLSQGGTKHPLAELPAPLIRPLYTLIPREATPET